MKVIEVGEAGVLRMHDRAEPHLRSGEVRIAVSYCGICGSDLHMKADPATAPGSVLGHEFSGVVTEVGPDVAPWRGGERVAILPYRSCGACFHCQAGAENFCVTGGHLGSVLGVDRIGGLSESVVAEADALLELPDGVTLKQGALVEPIAVAVRAADKVVSEPAGSVAIVGAGPIGLLVALVLVARGFTAIRLLDINDARLELASRLGVDTCQVSAESMVETLSDLGPMTTVDCTGAVPAIRAQVKAVQPRGRVVLVGLPGKPLDIDVTAAILREVQLVGSAGYARDDFARALALLAAGTMSDQDLVTSVLPVAEAADAFAELADVGTPNIKILLQHTAAR